MGKLEAGKTYLVEIETTPGPLTHPDNGYEWLTWGRPPTCPRQNAPAHLERGRFSLSQACAGCSLRTVCWMVSKMRSQPGVE